MDTENWKEIIATPWSLYWPVKNMNPDSKGFIHGVDYSFEGNIGHFNTYIGAIAAQVGQWEEFCEFHRNNRIKL